MWANVNNSQHPVILMGHLIENSKQHSKIGYKRPLSTWIQDNRFVTLLKTFITVWNWKHILLTQSTQTTLEAIANSSWLGTWEGQFLFFYLGPSISILKPMFQTFVTSTWEMMMEKFANCKIAPYTMPTIHTCSANFFHGYIETTLNTPTNVGHNNFLEPMLILIIYVGTLILSPH